MKVRLTHIGIFSLAKLLAIWAFVLGILATFLVSFISFILVLLGNSSFTSVAISFGAGLVGSVIYAVLAFIVGAIMAIVYNVILKVGGGLDFDFEER